MADFARLNAVGHHVGWLSRSRGDAFLGVAAAFLSLLCDVFVVGENDCPYILFGLDCLAQGRDANHRLVAWDTLLTRFTYAAPWRRLALRPLHKKMITR